MKPKGVYCNIPKDTFSLFPNERRRLRQTMPGIPEEQDTPHDEPEYVAAYRAKKKQKCETGSGTNDLAHYSLSDASIAIDRTSWGFGRMGTAHPRHSLRRPAAAIEFDYRNISLGLPPRCGQVKPQFDLNERNDHCRAS